MNKKLYNQTYKRGNTVEKNRSNQLKFLLFCNLPAILVLGLLFYQVNVFREPPLSLQNTSTHQGITMSNGAWGKNTLALLERTQHWTQGTYDGVFSSALSYDPYTSYYAVSLFQTLGGTFPLKQETIVKIKTSQSADGNFPCEHTINVQQEANNDEMSCLFYSVMSLHVLGAKPNNVVSVIQHINALQSQNGRYAFSQTSLQKLNTSPSTTIDLSATHQALTILYAYGAQPQKKELLTTWLVSQWAQGIQNGNDQMTQLSRLSAIADSLRLLGVSSVSLPNQDLYLHWANSLQQSLFILQHDEKSLQPVLFFIDDWVSLMHFLTNMYQTTPWLTSSFFQQLKTFQQTNGGFDIFLGTKPDIQGTFLAVQFYTSAHLPVPQKDEIISLLEKEMLPDGGFTSVNEKDPTITNALLTFISLQIRNILGDDTSVDLHNEMLITFVHGLVQKIIQNSQAKILLNSSAIRDVYYTIMLAKKLNIDINPLLPIIITQEKLVIQSLQNGSSLTMPQLVNLYYLSLLLQLNNNDMHIVEILIMNIYSTEGGFRITGVDKLETTWFALYSLKNINASSLKPEIQQKTIQWIEKQKGTDSGYGVNGSSNIYSSYYAVESLQLLKDTKDYQNDAFFIWLNSLKFPEGGFLPLKGYNSPDLLSTYYALIIFQQAKRPF